MGEEGNMKVELGVSLASSINPIQRRRRIICVCMGLVVEKEYILPFLISSVQKGWYWFILHVIRCLKSFLCFSNVSHKLFI